MGETSWHMSDSQKAVVWAGGQAKQHVLLWAESEDVEVKTSTHPTTQPSTLLLTTIKYPPEVS